MNHPIKQVIATEVLDSRGKPTLEARIVLENKKWGRAIVPSGASTGSREALELRDKSDSRYSGFGVRTALENIEKKIAPAIVGKSFSSIKELDSLLCELDGTASKSRLGANALLAVSMAYVDALSNAQEMPLYEWIASLGENLFHMPKQDLILPVPMINVLNGGAHANNGLDFQEFMLVPDGFATFSEAIEASARVFYQLKDLLHSKGLSTAVGDEGGFAPPIQEAKEALDFISLAIEKAGFIVGEHFHFALDVASSEFYEENDKKYIFKKSQSQTFDSPALLDFYKELIHRYPIISLEDPFSENDWDGWKLISEDSAFQKIQLVGDDLFVTQAPILQKGIDAHIANSILIKLNQVGTVSETLETILLAKSSGYSTVISHRSGETEDTFIADLALGMAAGQIKTGSLSRSERIAKYNRLLWIEKTESHRARYLGKQTWNFLHSPKK